MKIEPRVNYLFVTGAEKAKGPLEKDADAQVTLLIKILMRMLSLTISVGMMRTRRANPSMSCLELREQSPAWQL